MLQTIVLPEVHMKDVIRHLTNIPILPGTGKVVLTVEINCGIGGKVNTCKVMKKEEYELR